MTNNEKIYDDLITLLSDPRFVECLTCKLSGKKKNDMR